MEKQQRLSMSRLMTLLITIIPAISLSYILYLYAYGLLLHDQVTDLSNKDLLIKAMVNMLVFGTISVIYVLGMWLINSVIFKRLGQVTKSNWPKTCAYIGGLIIWTVGIITSLDIYV